MNDIAGFYNVMYDVGGNTYANTIYATSVEDLHEKVKERNLGERTIMFPFAKHAREWKLASELFTLALNEPDPVKRLEWLRHGLHCTVYENMMALHAGIIDDPTRLLDDNKPVHEAVHVLVEYAGDFGPISTGVVRVLKKLIVDMELIELALPGYLSPEERINIKLRMHERTAEVHDFVFIKTKIVRPIPEELL